MKEVRRTVSLTPIFLLHFCVPLLTFAKRLVLAVFNTFELTQAPRSAYSGLQPWEGFCIPDAAR
jgi:hypothetical protein